jgi:hypothetical protein
MGYSLGGFLIILIAILFVISLDKLWFRITIAIIALIGIVAIAYYGGRANV